MNSEPYIFDIVRGSTVDGPGLRTVVFLKGCPLRCEWCHNPESQDISQEIAYYPDKCVYCGECENYCPNNAINLKLKHIIISDKCKKCGMCSNICNFLALRQIGRHYSTDELYDIILKDFTYYKTSSGGVTFSGGEPLMHIEYLEPLFKRLKNANIHITIETCGFFNFEMFKEKLLPFTDIIFFDVKLINPNEHKHFTGKNNTLILNNLSKLSQIKSISLIPRIPLIPNITNTEANIEGIKKLLKSLKINYYKLLPNNTFGLNKWKYLNKLPLENYQKTL